YGYANDSPTRFFDPNGKWGVDMHFGGVYVAGRLQGASHQEALQAAIASQALDDYGNFEAPTVKGRSLSWDTDAIITFNPLSLLGGLPDAIEKPAAEFPNRLIPESVEPLRGLAPGHFIDPALGYRFANNAHALGVTRGESRDVAERAAAQGNNAW